jgi:hypothetical protein
LDYEPTNIWTKTDFGFERGKFATTGSNTFYDSQTIVGNVTFPSSSFISTTNASGGLFLSALNKGILQLNADGGEGDVIIGRSGWDGKLIVNGNQTISGSLNIAPQLPSLSIGDSFQGGKIAYLYTIGDGGYDINLVQGIVAAEVDEVTTLNWWEATASIDIKTTNGYTDWYLPSLAVLDVLYTNRAAIGGFNDSSRYWSSDENGVGGDAAVQVVFSDGTHTIEYKSFTYPTRAIRFFSVAKENALNVEGDIILSGSLNVTGSVNIDNIIKLAPVTNFPTGQAGMLVASASYGKTNLYMYDGSDWKWLVTGSIA